MNEPMYSSRVNMNTIHTCFERQVQQTPDVVAVISGNESWTYQALNNRANHLAAKLQRFNVTPDMQIALCMERSIEQLTAMLAILKVGCAYVPLDPSQPIERLNTILHEGDVSILLITEEEQTLFKHYKGILLVADQQEVALETNLLSMATSNNLAYVIYTSGSTGNPKGVLIEHQTVINYCKWYGNYTRAYIGQRIDWSGNYIFDMAVSTSIVPLMLGMTIVMCTDEIKKNPGSYLHYLHDNNINCIKISPSYFKALVRELSELPIELPHLQTLVLGGENLLTADCSAWLDRYPTQNLFNEYGPTEATVAVTQQHICKDNIDLFQIYVPIGCAASHVQCYILNDKNEPVLADEAGELHIGGDCLARGYLNHQVLTAEKFITDPFKAEPGARLYKTGDLCRQLPNGAIEFLGRMDQQIKLHGYRIEPGEIEVCLRQHPTVKDALVVICEGEHLVAYCILKQNNRTPSYTHMRKYLQHHLPDYMIPNNFVQIDKFPLTANGKLDHRALPLPSFSGNHHYLAPKTVLEKKIAAIWSKELGVRLIGINDNFFELGGHSLNAARIVADINNKLKCNIGISDFYHAETIVALEAVIKATQNEPSTVGIAVADADLSGKITPLADFQLLLWMLRSFEPNARKLNIVSRKRWHTHMDKDALNAAFEALLYRHDILYTRPKTLLPAQYQIQQGAFTLNETILSDHSVSESEQKLIASVNQLINFNGWSKAHPQIVARLFYLREGAELQICLPHFISDDASLDILWNDLFKFYQAHLTNRLSGSSIVIDKAKSFNDYIVREKKNIESHFEQDRLFWHNYFRNTQLLTFPTDQIIRNVESKGLNYSTYQEIPAQLYMDLEQYCSMNQVGLNAVLCAAVGLALNNIASNKEQDKPILMNIVKSTRSDKVWDETIGCFLRLDPIKVNVNKQDDLCSISKQIHQTMIKNAPRMHASSILKLAQIGTRNGNKKRHSVLKPLIGMYTKILQLFNLNYKSLELITQLVGFNQKNEYIVCVNLRNNFSDRVNKNTHLSWQEHEEKSIQMHQYDLENFDNVCDVSFLRDEDQGKRYVVVSSNLKPDFRRQIADAIIERLSYQDGSIATRSSMKCEVI